ncbi:AAA family ATPase [Emticicia sp.]|uniref:AAA family ATPase n=1 Tax=Emticicia sp. TaxID=1930953 RepID=UPI0037505D1A
MKIQKIQLQNFKRFTDLTIEGIPENTKLVLLIGANGSGKSSVFDAFELLNTLAKKEYVKGNNDYYQKDINGFIPSNLIIETQSIEGHIQAELKGDSYSFFGKSNIHSNSFYGRTSFRQLSSLTKTSLGSNIDTQNDADRPRLYIDRDERFENDIEKMTEDILKNVFLNDNSSKEIKRKYIEPINNALQNIFDFESNIGLELTQIIPPLDGKTAQITFKKGNSEIHYNLLSAGEKEVINILFNLLSRKDLLQDAILFFDEMDLHLNTSIQYNLLKELTENWIPDNSQLWTASHALGFIDYAHDFENAVIIDFDNLDFDKSQVLTPQSKENLEVFEIAVSKDTISKILKGRTIVFAENTDTVIYNNLSMTNTYFFNAIDKADVFHKAKNLHTLGLIDRDFLNDSEVKKISDTYSFLKVLPYYSIENLLFHPNNLEEYYLTINKEFTKVDYISALINVKNQELVDLAAGILMARNGYPFYKENESSKLLKDFRENWKDITKLLKSDDFETFYKVFPAKEYGRSLTQRANLSKINLGRTNWFRNQIEKIFEE